MRTLEMLHTMFTRKVLVLIACILIISIGTGTIYARKSRSYKSRQVTTANITDTTTPTPTPATVIAGDNLLTGQWQYMPGITKEGQNFVINPTKIAIVQQDGTGNTPNPPINLGGTHLEKVTGDFAITATLSLRTSKNATIQLYGKTPVIADEFRVERESVRMFVENGKLTVSTWNGSSQQSVDKTFPFAPADTFKLTITRQSGQLAFNVNDISLGNIKDSGIFNSGQVWFGLDSQDGSWVLSSITAQKLNGGDFQITDGSTTQITTHDPKGLQTLASLKRPGFIVGEAMALGPMVSDSDYANVALDKNMFGSLTPENQMKMINLQPQKGVYTFEQADALVKIAQQNGLTIHGHTLVFAEANPPWFNALPVKTAQDKQLVQQIMVDHIATVVKHFGDKINSWDVINEPLADYDQYNLDAGQVLRQHKWYQAMGADYITKALDTAHQANPNATLFINEYGLEADGDRWDGFIALMKSIKSLLPTIGIPTDKIGVGFQAHIYEAGDKIDPVVLRKHIQQMEQLGFKVQISENDVYNDDGDSVQASQYLNVFQACLAEKNCVAWRGWVLSDRYDYWRDGNGPIETGEDGLFGTDMKQRPGLTAILQMLN